MKKAESAMTIVFSLIFLAVILLFFNVIFLQSAASKTQYSINEITLGDTNINLINYLRTPLKDNFVIKDLIIDSYYNNKYEELEKNTEDILNKAYEKEKCPLWKIKGEANNEKIFEYESEFDIRKYTFEFSLRNIFNLAVGKYYLVDYTILYRTATFDLELPNPGKKIKITLVEGCKNE
jgi:hypothetical protein